MSDRKVISTACLMPESVDLGNGYSIQIRQLHGLWHAWLHTHFGSVCIGLGSTVDEARSSARHTLNAAWLALNLCPDARPPEPSSDPEKTAPNGHV
jgi:hypothetical protein